MIVARKFPRAKPYKLGIADVKALVRYRDGYRCTECGLTARKHHKRTKRTLDVHRLVPGSRYTVRGCVTLCRDCHSVAHGHGNGRPPRESVHLPEELQEALIRHSELNGMTKSEIWRVALQEFLERRGFWPPPQS